MFDIGGVELIVVAAVAILVVGPSELPGMLRAIGRFVKQAREMSNSVQRQFNDALKEAELDGVKKTFDDVRSLNPANQIKRTLAKELNPMHQIGDRINNAAKGGTVQSGAVKASASKAASAASGGESAGVAAGVANRITKPATKAASTTSASPAPVNGTSSAEVSTPIEAPAASPKSGTENGG